MATRPSGLQLLELPSDIHKLIIGQLKPTSLVFIPRYSEDDSLGNLEEKAKEFYGEPKHGQTAGAEALLNWSLTCRYFRHLIAPDLYETVVLRSKPKSVESVKALSQTSYWNNVRHFIFAGTYEDKEGYDVDDDSDRSFDEHEEETVARLKREAAQRVKEEMDKLSGILSNLPPNLKSLTLDFPNNWELEYDNNMLEDWDGFFTSDDGSLEEAETIRRYLAQMRTAFEAVPKIDLSQRPDLELRIFNLSPIRCSALEKRQMSLWLKQLSSLTIALCHADDGAGWEMNKKMAPFTWADQFDSLWLNHLDNVRTFRLHGDNSWPLGLSPGYNHVKLNLPSSSVCMPKVAHVSFQEVFVCKELVDFLVAHASTLESVELINCYANAAEHSLTEAETPPFWADLFTALADAKPSRLTYINVFNPASTLEDLLSEPCDDEDIEDLVPEVQEALDKQRDEEINAYKHKGAKRADVRRRRKRIFAHCSLDEKYGEVCQDSSRNTKRFLSGEDHEAYMRLVEVVEENMQALQAAA